MPSSRPPFVIANWKMHGCHNTNKRLLAELRRPQRIPSPLSVVVCPPFVYLPQLKDSLDDSGIALGAQNLSDHASGAYTGEISAAMLVDCGCSYVIVGHSERRIAYGENDAMIRRKLKCACEVNLCPVLCVGETAEQRQHGQAQETVARQLEPLKEIAGMPCLVAYEPVWAIGTNQVCAPDMVAEMHSFIGQCLMRLNQPEAAILYGGSLKPASVAAIFAADGVDGGLIGGASLRADDFLAICHAAVDA